MFDRFLEQTKNMPKVFDAKTHAVLDYLTVGAFFIMGGAFWGRHKRATAVSLLNGLFVLGYSVLTDYDGDGRRPISFETHGKLDVAQATLAGGLPTVLGFRSSKAALPFKIQSVNELFFISVTDFQRQGTIADRRRKQAA